MSANGQAAEEGCAMLFRRLLSCTVLSRRFRAFLMLTLLLSGCLISPYLQAAPQELSAPPGEDVPIAHSVPPAHRRAHPPRPLPVWQPGATMPPPILRGTATQSGMTPASGNLMPSGSGGPNAGPSPFAQSRLPAPGQVVTAKIARPGVRSPRHARRASHSGRTVRMSRVVHS